jgi:hypothetical protein
MEQHGFTIEVEVVTRGESFRECFDQAMEIAEEFNETYGDQASIVVKESGSHLFIGVPNGVYCEGCEDGIFPGIRWPSATNGDTNHEWIERCDSCERYPDDFAAAEVVLQEYRENGSDYEYDDETIPTGCTSPQPYLDLEVG